MGFNSGFKGLNALTRQSWLETLAVILSRSQGKRPPCTRYGNFRRSQNILHTYEHPKEVH